MSKNKYKFWLTRHFAVIFLPPLLQINVFVWLFVTFLDNFSQIVHLTIYKRHFFLTFAKTLYNLLRYGYKCKRFVKHYDLKTFSFVKIPFN